MLGKRHTEEAKSKMSELRKGKQLGDDNPARLPWVKEKISSSQKERLRLAKINGTGSYSQQYKDLQSKAHSGAGNSNAKRFTCTDPTGNVTVVIGKFKSFCKEKNIGYYAIIRRFENDVCHYNGWHIVREHK